MDYGTTNKIPANYEFTKSEAKLLHVLIKSHIAAIHNWTASAIEQNDIVKAKDLIEELRDYQKLFARTNVEAHELIERIKSK